VELADTEPGEAMDARVDAAGTQAADVQSPPVHIAHARETAPLLDLQHETESTTQETAIAATFVSGEAIVLRQATAPALLQTAMIVSADATAQPAMIVSADATAQPATRPTLRLDTAPALASVSPAADFGPVRPENALLQLASQSIASAAATLAVFAGEPAPANVADRNGNVARQPLEMLLGERLQVQIARRSEHAVVRLDPPSMGTIEIVIRQEGAHLQVHLRASNGEVARQLQVIGETLRQDLVQRQHGEVSVHVWDSSREGERQRQRAPLPWQDEPGRALNEDGEERAAFAMSTASE
jgi:flagellar hook-length control protein FliK